MASSNDDDNRYSKDTSESKNDNPFIKFRQFADSQISSLLQGIVGLPSAFSKSPNNARWADFDDDLKRRDELQERQNDIRRYYEARKEIEGRGWPAWNTDDEDEHMDEKTAREIPLYSPVVRSLFTHLQCANGDGDVENEWKPVDGNPVVLYPSIYDSLKAINNPFTSLQEALYKDLQRSPIFRSDYSLLPYILHSPYSPLRLAIYERQPGDHFEYAEAFVDLMLITQNRPMGSIPFNTTAMNLPRLEPERSFLYTLWAHGVLQQKSTTKFVDVLNFQQKVSGGPLAHPVVDPKASQDQSDADSNPETELEAYERFLRRAFESNSVDSVESFFSNFSGWVKEELKNYSATDLEAQMNGAADFLEHMTGNKINDEKRAQVLEALESVFAQTSGLREKSEDRKRILESFSGTKIAKELEEVKRLASTDSTEPGKPISSSTTTESTTNSDGWVETRVTVQKEYGSGENIQASSTTTEHTKRPDGLVISQVVVWKKFADGRETTTSTSHTEEKARSQADVWASKPNDEALGKKTDEESDEQKGKKQGWFWN